MTEILRFSSPSETPRSHVLNFRTTSGHNVLYMRNDVLKEMLRFRLPSSGQRRLLLKVYMKRNHSFNILKVQHFKDTISKFEPCSVKKKNCDFITSKNCAILLSKMVFESRGQNVLTTQCCGQDYEIAIRYGVYWLYTTSISLSSFEDSKKALNSESLDMLFFLRNLSQ